MTLFSRWITGGRNANCIVHHVLVFFFFFNSSFIHFLIKLPLSQPTCSHTSTFNPICPHPTGRCEWMALRWWAATRLNHNKQWHPRWQKKASSPASLVLALPCSQATWLSRGCTLHSASVKESLNNLWRCRRPYAHSCCPLLAIRASEFGLTRSYCLEPEPFLGPLHSSLTL